MGRKNRNGLCYPNQKRLQVRDGSSRQGMVLLLTLRRVISWEGGGSVELGMGVDIYMSIYWLRYCGSSKVDFLWNVVLRDANSICFELCDLSIYPCSCAISSLSLPISTGLYPLDYTRPISLYPSLELPKNSKNQRSPPSNHQQSYNQHPPKSCFRA